MIYTHIHRALRFGDSPPQAKAWRVVNKSCNACPPGNAKAVSSLLECRARCSSLEIGYFQCYVP